MFSSLINDIPEDAGRPSFPARLEWYSTLINPIYAKGDEWANWNNFITTRIVAYDQPSIEVVSVLIHKHFPDEPCGKVLVGDTIEILRSNQDFGSSSEFPGSQQYRWLAVLTPGYECDGRSFAARHGFSQKARKCICTWNPSIPKREVN